MQVTIWSRMAALAGRHEQVWTGDVPSTVMSGLDTEAPLEQRVDAVNERLFRLFNRVDLPDAERLDDWGYRLPSLSVGDVVTHHGNAYEVAGIGFQPLPVRV